MIKTREQLIKAYLTFFKNKKHKIIRNAPLVPEHDPTVLFTTAGMHPLVPFILGTKHPQGKRLANVQKCIRTRDIEEVGDDLHLTFFEMLGNWSLGDYWKKQAIEFSYEFLTSKEWLNLNPERLHITLFAGDKEIPRDVESAEIWEKLGIPKERIYFLSRKDNFWGPAGKTGPCGPCTEIFYDTGKPKCSQQCKPGCNCGKYFEIWNDVFMEYNKLAKGYTKLKQRNVDTGMGVERTVAMLEHKKSIYDIEVFSPIIKKIRKIAKIQEPDKKQEKSIRIITDHLKAATFILAEGIIPSNLDRGYVLRRLIRRAIRHGRFLGINNFAKKIVEEVIKIYQKDKDYKYLEKNRDFIFVELEKEEQKFLNTLEKGMKKFEQLVKDKEKISGKDAFLLFQSYGFPLEMTREMAREKNLEVDVRGFHKELEKHQQISRQATEKRFKAGLADITKETTKLHTATHLLHQALRDVLGKQVQQKGSNITKERLRFDFSYDKKLTEEQIKKVEKIVNDKIKQALPVKKQEMTPAEAKKQGALSFFEEKYGKKVFVYSIGNYSKEVCAGPHVKNTKELGKFKIIKEEGIGAGVRRIKAVLES
ncbi:alanine--tRNA ligase [Candidatus Pacearchaeota archaeon ex4484_26]|nr:MAG: alanine--tRNA ligase [Candidatus Pacearchaeota archaeon ex4484_26]